MHNARARALLGVPPVDASVEARRDRAAAVDGSPERLGSLFERIDRRQLANAFDEVERRVAAGADAPHVVFVTAPRPDRLVRVKVLQVPGSSSPACYVIHLRPAERWSDTDAARHRLLRELAEGLRDPLASVRAAIETITEYPDMDAAVAAQFERIILDQTVALNQRLEEALDAYARVYRARWPLDEMAGRDLLAMLHARLERALDVPVEARPDADKQGLMRVRIDAHVLPEAVLFLARRIINAAQCDRLVVGLQPVRRFVAVDLMWDGRSVSQNRLDQWEAEAFNLGDTVISMTLRETVDHHDAEIWAQDGRVRLVLPAE